MFSACADSSGSLLHNAVIDSAVDTGLLALEASTKGELSHFADTASMLAYLVQSSQATIYLS